MAGSAAQSAVNSLYGFFKQAVAAVDSKAAQYEGADIGITYVSKRVLAMPFPSTGKSSTVNGIGNIDAMAGFLNRYHKDRYMIWNLSEKAYDYSKFNNSVIEFRFPGYPAPPLDQIFTICQSLDGWLSADAANVAVIHCQTGRGRTVSLIAAYLTWSHETNTTSDALSICVRKMSLPISHLVIPTQQRYLSYVTNVLNGKRPALRTLQLERVILSGVPHFDNSSEGRCRPYLQIFQSSRLLYTSTGREAGLRWYNDSDSHILFPVSLVLQGDILIRVRHLSADLKRISMLRLGFHTGFIPTGTWRLKKAELDGAANDDKFGEDFFIDIVCRANDDTNTGNAPAALNAVTPHASQTAAYWQQIAARKAQIPTAMPAASDSSTKGFFPFSFNLFTQSVTPAPGTKGNTTADASKTAASSASSSSAASSSSSASGSAKKKTRAGAPSDSNADSFEDLQKYVAGLGQLDFQEMDGDSDEGELEVHKQESKTTNPSQQTKPAKAANGKEEKSNKGKTEDLDLLSDIGKHLAEEEKGQDQTQNKDKHANAEANSSANTSKKSDKAATTPATAKPNSAVASITNTASNPSKPTASAAAQAAAEIDLLSFASSPTANSTPSSSSSAAPSSSSSTNLTSSSSASTATATATSTAPSSSSAPRKNTLDDLEQELAAVLGGDDLTADTSGATDLTLGDNEADAMLAALADELNGPKDESLP